MKILVVEDDPLVVEALTAILADQNYAIETAQDGEAAWDLIDNFDYDLVLLDVILPKLDGISLCRQIRSKGLKMPILLLTGKNNSHDKAVGLDAGADDYLVKPFDAEELLARMRALLRRGTITSQPVLSWGKLQLDPTSCEVTYNKQLLSLTPKEYALLELFLRNNRRVFSCGMILEHLWSYEDIPGEEAVRTHIKGLRHKLKTAGAGGDLIETVYGIGYRLKPQETPDLGSSSPSTKKSGSSKSLTPDDKTQQQTLKAIANVWQRFKGRIDSQVSLLQQAVEALSKDGLSQELRNQAYFEAHTLAGSLGTFGFADGSNQAREIEKLLKGDRVLSSADAAKLCTLVNALQKQIESQAQQTQETSPVPQDERPLILIVDSDPVEEIAKQASSWGLRVTVAESIEAAKNKLSQESPSLVILDPDVSPNHEDSFRLLAELKGSKGNIPAIVFTNATDFNNRLQAARGGGHAFLQKPMSAQQVLESAMQALQQSQKVEAKILAVDDDPKILALLQALLTPWGLRVQTLDDPRRFWETLEIVKPDLLILDVEMPYTSGIELCQVVRNDPKTSELPVLFLTVHTDAEIVNQVFTAGADDYVSKPIVGPELVTRIVNRLERIKLLQRMTQTQQRALEETATALRNSQSLFAGIVAIADDAIISIDSNQKITLFNQGAEKIFGYSANEVLGRPLDLLLPFRYTQAHRQHIAEFREAANNTRKMAERREIYGRRKDGTEFSAEASISKFKLGEDAVYTVYLQDVSDRKQIERIKDEFVSIVSHELRTPLTSIHGSLGMLSSGLIKPESEQGKRLLQIATDSTQRLVLLINDILDIERIESGKVKMEKVCCNVAQIITEAVNVMQPLADKAGITLSVTNLSANIWADPDRIVQTLTNLLSNAIKFSTRGSAVNVEAQQQDSFVLFAVKDTGRGIPTDKLETIFERFQQVDASDSRKQDGTGLGLAICKSIVQQHEGRIWAESTVGSGSNFYFTAPNAKFVENPQLKDSASTRPPKVLLCDVEDNAEIASLLATVLVTNNIETYFAKTGKEAISKSQEINPDLMILDLALPEGDGFAVVDWLKQHNYLQNIPLLVYSAKDLDDSERQKLKLGYTEFLIKGRVTVQEFSQRAIAILQRITQNKEQEGNNDKQADFNS